MYRTCMYAFPIFSHTYVWAIVLLVYVSHVRSYLMCLLPRNPITRKELRDVSFLILAFSCVIASLTITVGSGGVVILSVGGSASLAPVSLAAVFIGMALVSLLATHWMFSKWGRKIGFWVGSLIGVIGALVGWWGLARSSAAIVLVAQSICGAGLGIGMYVRYSGGEVVAKEHSVKAMTWVLAGGCIAAFIGPEISQATAGLFGDQENLKFLGTFVVAGGFFILHAICIWMVDFPPLQPAIAPGGSTPTTGTEIEEIDIESGNDKVSKDSPKTLLSVLPTSTFLIPLGIAVLSWALMAMPMGIFRITMKEVGFSERQSLTVIEFHFLAMYGTGFWTGSFIKKHGVIRACQLSLLLFVLSMGIHLSLQSHTNTTAGWYIGMILLGMAWNIGFSSATAWSTKSYEDAPYLKPKVQAANECLMFLFSGALMFSTGHIYKAGGGEISGWRFLKECCLSWSHFLGGF